MAYQLKSTGIAANCIMCLAVDPDTGTIKDFASSAVTADMTVGANVTISTQTFDGITRHYWRPGSGTTDADFVKFGTNKPAFDFDASNTTRSVVWIGQTDTAGISRFFGDSTGNYFAHLDLGAGGSTHPAIAVGSSSYNGAQANPSNAKRICGWVLTRGSTRVWYTAADTDASMTTGSAALGSPTVNYTLDYVDRIDSSTTHQRQFTHLLAIFNTALAEADFDSLRDDFFTTLLESASSATSAPPIRAFRPSFINTI